MKVVIQRVNNASVHVDGKLVSEIGKGLLVFVGIDKIDTDKDIVYTSGKITGLRIFPDGEIENMFSLKDVKGELLLVSQFTLQADVKKGKRPSFSDAMNSKDAGIIFDKLYKEILKSGVKVKCGVFQAKMIVRLENTGPYTIVFDSRL